MWSIRIGCRWVSHQLDHLDRVHLLIDIGTECKNLLSRMLVPDSQLRARMTEILHHPWTVKGFDAPPDNFIPYREPLQLPLDPEIVNKMTEFDLGSPDQIMQELESILRSEDYRHWEMAFRNRLAMQESKPKCAPERNRGIFEFYKRESDMSCSPPTKQHEVYDPPCHPMISIYYLVREKIERERQEAQTIYQV